MKGMLSLQEVVQEALERDLLTTNPFRGRFEQHLILLHQTNLSTFKENPFA